MIATEHDHEEELAEEAEVGGLGHLGCNMYHVREAKKQRKKQ